MPVTRTEVTEIYVATFNRAPDEAGLDYWVVANLTIEEIAASFFMQEETQELYLDTLSNAEFVDAVYNNVYNHSGDPDGAAYWIAELDEGTPKNMMIIAMVNGARGIDQDTLDNKTEVGLYFAENDVALTLEQAYEVMADVTDDDQSVADAEAQIDAWNGIATSYTLTTDTDTIVGTDLDNVITGLVADDATDNTLNAADTMDGGGGADIFNLTINAIPVPDATTVLTPIANMSNVETLNIINDSVAILTDKQIINLAGTTGVETIISAGTGVSDVTVNSVAAIVDLDLDATAIRTTTVTYDATVVVDGDDSMDITNNSAVAQTVTVAGIEKINLHLTGKATSDTTLDMVNLNTLVVDGETGAGTSLVGAAGSSAKVIDLSATTGVGVTVGAGLINITGSEIISGGGADTIHLRVGDDTVTYTRADQSQGTSADNVGSGANRFETGSDKINLTLAIDNAGGTSTGNDLTEGAYDDTITSAMTLGDLFNGATVMINIVELTAVAYIDVNTNGKWDADDMTINIRCEAIGLIDEGDFIV